MKVYQQITLLVILSVMFGVCAGITITQQVYENRANEIPEKECYSIRDIEHILFNESQE